MQTAQIQTGLLSAEAFLAERLQLIYKNRDVAEKALRRILHVTEQRRSERPADLRLIDEQRKGNPGWFTSNHFFAYTCYVDKFAGNLKGVEKRIPHLENLGVNYLHLLPFLKARPGSNDGGFAVEDFLQVEPALGTNDDLVQLASNLRSKGISLCSDLVLNHVADTHAWAKAARENQPGALQRFHFKSKQETEQLEKLLPQIFPQTAPGNFVFIPELQQYVWSTFYPYQWDLNYGNPDVLVDMIDNMLALANMGVEIFRLDSAAFLWKKENTNCMNQPECHWILQCFRCAADLAAPGVLLKAEAIVPTHQLPPYFGEDDAHGRECHLAYQSSLMAASWYCLANQDASLIQHMLENMPPMADETSWISYVRCHDDIGWNVLKPELQVDKLDKLLHASRFFGGRIPGSYAKGLTFQASDDQSIHGTNGMTSDLVGWTANEVADPDPFSEARFRLMMAFMFSTGGIPMIYMGDELAQQGQHNMNASEWLDTRELHRPSFDELAMLESKQEGTRASRALTWIRHLREIHRTFFRAGNTSAIHCLPSPHPSTVLFQHGNVLCLFNFSNLDVCLPGILLQGQHDLLGNSIVDCNSMAPYQALFLKQS